MLSFFCLYELFYVSYSMNIEKSIVKSGFDNGLLSDSHRYKYGEYIISMVAPCTFNNQSYEIFSIEGDLFDDCERYNTLDEGEDRIKELFEAKEIETKLDIFLK